MERAYRVMTYGVLILNCVYADHLFNGACCFRLIVFSGLFHARIVFTHVSFRVITFAYGYSYPYGYVGSLDRTIPRDESYPLRHSMILRVVLFWLAEVTSLDATKNKSDYRKQIISLFNSNNLNICVEFSKL